MNPRDIGKRYECDEAKLWMLPALDSLKSQIVRSVLDRLLPYDTSELGNVARSIFVILEANVLDVEWKAENSIADYWYAREGKTIGERWELFTLLVKGDEWGFIIDAHISAQPKELLNSGMEENEKKESSQP